jgi:carboxymethylenebutenolidase
LPPDTGWIQIGDIPAYRAQPEGAGPFPVVLVVQEIFGVTPHMQDICRRFAALGYLAIAPELYARQGDVSAMQDRNEIRKIVAQVPDAQVMSDLDAAVAGAEASGAGDTSRLFLTGFCWGGRIAWLYAAHSDKLKGAVAWYGRVEHPLSPLQPRSPLDIAGELRCPVLGLYGGQDAGIPLDSVERMRAAAGPRAEIVIYPEAGHGFFADYRPSYHPAAAQDGWERLLNWFRKHGACK